MALCHIWDRYMGCDGTDSVVSDWSVIHFSMYAEIVKYSSKYFGSLPVVLSEPGSLTFCILKYVTFSYTIFSFALMEKPTFAKYFSQADISYGLYLYGFFVQQIVVYLFNKSSIVIGEIWLLVFCIGITCIIALLSFLCVEKPMQQLSKKILARL